MTTLPAETRSWAMFTHLSAALCQFLFPTFGFVGPMLISLVRKEDEVQAHARQAMYFQLAVFVVAWLAGMSCFLAPLSLLAYIAGIVVPVIAGIKVNNDEPWSYPLTGSFGG